MYSVVLMAALTTGGDSPDFLFRCRGCRGCHSCACSGCYGGCHGCWGVWSGGMHGWSYGYGCVGCYGCAGYMASNHGHAVGAGHPHAHAYGYPAYSGMYACYGGWTGYGCAGGFGGPVPPTAPQGPRERVVPPGEGPNSDTAIQSRVVLTVPADAKLYVDGVQTRQTAERRVFVTPPLEPGRSYFYEMRVEVVRNGRTLSETRQLVIRPGENTAASFANLGAPNSDVQIAERR